MPRTPEERAATNRANASKSTGPKTEEGKAASRRNSTRHGLRADALALPHEDPAVAAARADAWNDYYRPQSPAAQHLVNQCVAATLLADRCNAYHTAAVARQVREADQRWLNVRDQALANEVWWFQAEPDGGARELSATAAGCRWQIDRWEELVAALEGRGWWTGPERNDAIRLQTPGPVADRIKESPEVWQTRLFSLLCEPTRNVPAIQELFLPQVCPDVYRGAYLTNSFPSTADCRAGLRAMAAARLEALRMREQEFRARREDPDRAEAAARASILSEGPSAHLFLRYHAEARTAFHRAYGALVKALALDAETAAADPIPDGSPNEASSVPAPAPVAAPVAAPAAPTAPVSPNEASCDPPGAAATGPIAPPVVSAGANLAAETPAPAVTDPSWPVRTEGATVPSGRRVA